MKDILKSDGRYGWLTGRARKREAAPIRWKLGLRTTDVFDVSAGVRGQSTTDTIEDRRRGLASDYPNSMTGTSYLDLDLIGEV